MELLDLIANTAIVVTIAQFLSGIQICHKIYKKKSTVDVSPFPFMAGALCNYLWLSYGLLLSDRTMISVNLIGITLQSFYLVWFWLFTLNKTSINKQLLLLFSSCVLLLYAFQSSAQPKPVCGTFACLSSLLFCGAPMFQVAEVIKTRTTEKLPFALILSSFACTVLWFLYGYLLKDAFIQVPNGISALLCSIQLALFVVYPSSTQAKAKTNKDDLSQPLVSEELSI